MRLLNIFFIIILWLLPAACNTKNQQPATGKLQDWETNPENTFNYYKNESALIRDSVYGLLFIALADSEKYGLLEKHLAYYGQIESKGTYFDANIAFAKGWIYTDRVRYDSAASLLSRATDLYLQAGAKRNAAFSCFGQGINYFYLAEYGKAIAADYKSIDLYASLKDTHSVNRIKISIAASLIREQEYQQALDICNHLLSYYSALKDFDHTSYLYSLMMQVYYYQNEYDVALQYARLSLEDALKTNNQSGIGGSYNNLASVYIGLKRWNDALDAYRQSKKWVDRSGDNTNGLIVETNIANCLWNLGEKSEAENLVLEIIESAKATQRKDVLLHGYGMLYKMSKEVGNYRNALQYYELQSGIRDSVFNDEKHRIIQELNVRYETSEKDHKIRQMKAEQKAGYTQKIILVLVLLVITVSGIMIIVVLAGKNKRHKLSLRNKQLEMEGYKKDLASFTERILHKNKLIEELQQRNETEVQSPSGNNLPDSENVTEHISKLYQLKILTDEDWLQFKLLFDKAFPGGIATLRMQWPDITAAEERQFLLIKLNISNKESADMLGISLQSIKKNRYRLKKRFGLTEEQDLDEFVKQIE